MRRLQAGIAVVGATGLLALTLATGAVADTRHLGYHDCRDVSYGTYVSAYSRADGSDVQRHTYLASNGSTTYRDSYGSIVQTTGPWAYAATTYWAPTTLQSWSQTCRD